jgi:hypothetical protein
MRDTNKNTFNFIQQCDEEREERGKEEKQSHFNAQLAATYGARSWGAFWYK